MLLQRGNLVYRACDRGLSCSFVEWWEGPSVLMAPEPPDAALPGVSMGSSMLGCRLRGLRNLKSSPTFLSSKLGFNFLS